MAEQSSTSSTRLPPAGEVRQIACLMLGGIGDLLATTPTMAALKGLFPKSRLSLIIRPWLLPLMSTNPHVDAVIGYDSGSLWKRLGFFRSLRRQRFDLWVDLHMPTFHTVASAEKVFLRNALIMMAARPRFRLGYGVRFLRRKLTHAVPVPPHEQLATENIVDTTLALVGPPPGTSRRKVMPIAKHDREWAESRLPGITGKRFGLFFGGLQTANHWPIPRVSEFVTRLLTEHTDAELVLIGNTCEELLASGLLDAVDPAHHQRITSLVGRADLGQTAAVLQRCAAAVCTDSGPMHIADAVGTPLVALFCGKNYLPIWVPTGTRSVVLYHHVECAPCFRSECPVGNMCMDQIRGEEVLAALRRVLTESM